ncbi:MAG: GNAT family N-acetyltransferase [Myxococcota bacterium]
MTAKLRFARPEDAPTLHRLVCELAAYERAPEAVEVTAEHFQRQMSQPRPPFEAILAEREVDGAITAAGVAVFFHHYSTWKGCAGLYLEDLFVSPEHRGHGIGTMLLGALARLAKERGGARLEWSVLDWNEKAAGFYQGLGARPMAGWKVYRLTDAPLAALAERGPAVANEPA